MKLQTSKEIEEIIAGHQAELDRLMPIECPEHLIRDLVHAIETMKGRLRLARIEEMLSLLLDEHAH